MDEAAREGSGGPVKSALRVMLIIELLTEHDTGLTFPEILERLDVPKSSLHGLLRTLAERGHLVHDPGQSSYRLGVRYWEAGQAFLRGKDLPRISRPFLDAAKMELDETVQLAILDGLEHVYIAKVEADHHLQLVSHVGSRLPAYATGLGKALLAGLDDAELTRRLRGVRLERFTEHTIEDKQLLREHLAAIRGRGYATDNGEYTPGVFCVAVQINDHEGKVAAAMSCSVPQVRNSTEMQQRMVRVLMEQSERLSVALGYRPHQRTAG